MIDEQETAAALLRVIAADMAVNDAHEEVRRCSWIWPGPGRPTPDFLAQYEPPLRQAIQRRDAAVRELELAKDALAKELGR